MSKYPRGRYLLAALLVGAGLLCLFCSIRLTGLAADDSFIHRRIALHLLQSGRADFNQNEHVMVTSSPLWTILLALTGVGLHATYSTPVMEVIFVLLGATAAFLLVCELASSESDSAPAEGPTLFLAALCFLFVVLGELPSLVDQMETACALSLILWGTVGLLRDRSWGMPLIVLACFTRYECVLFFLLAAGWVTLRRRWTIASFASVLAIGAAGIAWLLYQYKTVIPNTVVAKSHLYIMTYKQPFLFLFVSWKRFALALAIGVVWWLYSKRRERTVSPGTLLFAFGVLLCALYIARKTYVFAWYIPLAILPIVVGILLATRISDFKRMALGAAFGAVFLISAFRIDITFLQRALHAPPLNVAGFPNPSRVHEYLRIGRSIYKECPNAVLMTSEIGGLGWGFQGKLLDGAGLASPEAIHYHPMRVPEERSDSTWGEIPGGFIKERHPDVIVSYDMFAESALPVARSLGYVDYTYPLFVREDRSTLNTLWQAKQMHVLLASNGVCPAAQLDQEIRRSLEE